MAYDQQVKQTINGTDVIPIVNAAPQANTTGAITTSTTTITVTDLTGIGSATVQISGTHAGINMTFESSADAGTTWFPVQAMNQSTNVLTTAGVTGVVTTNATVVWTVSPLLGQSQFRVRATAFTSGSGAIVIHPSTQFVALPISSQTVTGTVTANINTVTVGATSLGKAEDAVHASGDYGIANWAVRNDNAITSLTSANGDYSPYAVDQFGVTYIKESPANTATTANVAAATSSTTILAANTARRAAIFVNDSTSDAYLKYGTTASSTSYTVQWVAGSTITVQGEEYAGIVTAIWNSATGNARVTETVS